MSANQSNGLDVRGAGTLGPRGQRVGGSGGGRRSRARQSANVSLPSPRDLLFVLFRHRVRAMAVAITIFILTLLAALVLPSKYTSEAQLLVRMGRESLPNSTVAGGPQVVPMVDRTTEINSEAQIFRSREVVAATVKKLGVDELLGQTPSSDPKKLEAQEAAAANVLANAIDIRTEPMSAIIKVTYDARTPAKARDVVQTYVDSYLDHRSRLYGSAGAGELFEGLTQDTEGKLKSIEESIKKLKDQTGVTDVDTQKTILLNRIATLQQTIDTASAQLASTLKRITALEDQLGRTDKQIAMSQTTGEAMGVVSEERKRINELRAQLDRASGIYLPDSTTIVQLKEQIASAQTRLADLEKDGAAKVMGLNPTWSLLDGQLANERTNQEGLAAQLESLTAELKRAKDGQAQINDVELKMGQLAREKGMVVEQLKKVVEGRNYSSIDQAMGKDRVGSVSASQRATLPESASSPNRKLLVLFGMFAAVVGGMATAFASEMLDHSVNKPQDLKRLGFRRIVSIPLLGVKGASEQGGDESLAPSSDTQAIVDLTEHDTVAGAAAPTPERLRPTRYVRSTARPDALSLALKADANLSPREMLQQWKSRPAAPEAKAEAPVNGHNAPPVVVNPPPSRPLLTPRFLESAHALLERLVFAPVASGEFEMPRSIAVLSVTPGQGASAVAAHFAAALADYLPNGDDTHESGRILIVDGNLAAPAQHRIFDAANEPGISDWIKQPTAERALGDFVRPTAVPKLDLLTAGAASVGQQPGRWTEAVGVALNSEYQSVIVDLPSMARSESTARVAGMCDAAVLVVECGGVNREVVRQAALRLAESGVRLLGVVLNKRTYPIPDKLYRWF